MDAVKIICGVDAPKYVPEGSDDHAEMRAQALAWWRHSRGDERPARETLTVVPLGPDVPAHLSGLSFATRLDLWANG